MRSFRLFALITTVATYLLIFMGGLVRVSGAGLGCPDWPKCFGRWIPPTDISQLPSDIDLSHFNFTLAWIEYINRLMGVAVGFLILITAILALKNFRRVPRIVYPAAGAAVLVAFQGWQGSVVVASELEPIIVTVHMLLALIIVSLLIYVTQQAYYLEKPHESDRTGFPKEMTLWIAVLWSVAIVQVVLGTQIRSALEVISDRFPLASAAEWLSEAGVTNHVHLILGFTLAALTLYVGNRIIKQGKQLSPIVRQSVVASMILVLAQIGIGLGFLVLGIPAVMQVFHLWVASLYIGALLVLFSAAGRVKRIS